MSRKPGIGATWLDKYYSDVYPRGNIYMNDLKLKPPKYYDKYFKSQQPLQHEQLQYENLAKFNHADNTPQRLEDKNTYTKAKLKLKKRSV